MAAGLTAPARPASRPTAPPSASRPAAAPRPAAASAPGLGALLPDDRLRRLELTVTRRLNGLLHGDHRGLLPGSGSEIAGSREYRAGEDEVRRMDWAVTARTGVPHVRETDADRELSTWVLVDGTASMDFGTADLEKRELAVAAVAAVGFLTAGGGNRLGALVLRGDGMRRLPARGGRHHLLALLRGLLTAPHAVDAARPAARRGRAERPAAVAAPAAGLPEGCAAMGGLATRRGLVVVVSDFLDGFGTDENAPPAWERPLRRLAARHQVLAVEVTDPREQELPDVGVITMVDPETGRRREVDTGNPRLRRRFADAAAAQRVRLTEALRRCGAAHLALRTDRDFTTDIVRHVHAQRRLALASYARSPGGAAA